MSTWDFDAIASAIATRFSSTYLTAPTGESAMRSAVYKEPAGLHPPCVVVYPPNIPTIEYMPGGMRTATFLWPVRFYLAAPQDYGRVTGKILKWMTVIYGQLDGKVQLGLAYVDWALPVAMTVGEMPFGDAGRLPGMPGYPGIELMVQTQLQETFSPVA